MRCCFSETQSDKKSLSHVYPQIITRLIHICDFLFNSKNISLLCFIRCVCEPKYTGKNCESVYIPCVSSSPCQHGGTCVQHTRYNTYECKCPPGESIFPNVIPNKNYPPLLSSEISVSDEKKRLTHELQSSQNTKQREKKSSRKESCCKLKSHRVKWEEHTQHIDIIIVDEARKMMEEDGIIWEKACKTYHHVHTFDDRTAPRWTAIKFDSFFFYYNQMYRKRENEKYFYSFTQRFFSSPIYSWSISFFFWYFQHSTVVRPSLWKSRKAPQCEPSMWSRERKKEREVEESLEDHNLNLTKKKP